MCQTAYTNTVTLSSLSGGSQLLIEALFQESCFVSCCLRLVADHFAGATAQDPGGDGAQEGGGATQARGGGAQTARGGGREEEVSADVTC